MSRYVAPSPREILPHLTQWTVAWPRYPMESYAIETTEGCIVIDPNDYPPNSIGAIERQGVSHVVITNHFHERAAAIFRDRFGAELWAPEGDTDQLETGQPDHIFSDGTELPARLRAISLGQISAGEHALLWPENRGVLFVGDALGTTSYWTHSERPLGAHPRARPPHDLKPLLDLPFTSLAVGHGEPVLDCAKEMLRTYLDEATRE